jgi:hypothetical protein
MLNDNLKQVMDKNKAKLLALQKKSLENLSLHFLTKNDLSPKGNPALWTNKSYAKWAKAHGYEGGRFIANWQYTKDISYSVNFPFKNGKEFSKLPPSVEDYSFNNIHKDIETMQLGGAHYLINNQPYASRLNKENWSTQAPSVILDRIVLNWQSIVDASVKEINHD